MRKRITNVIGRAVLITLAGVSGVLSSGIAAQQPAAQSDSVVTSYYANRYNGRRTASGERFSNSALTAAHREYPFGTRLRLTNPSNGRSAVVRVNDRGPFVNGRDLSVTRRAARQLGFVRSGVTPLKLEVVPAGSR